MQNSRNILIFNVSESKTSLDDTKTIVTNILNNLVLNVSIIKSVRLVLPANKPRQTKTNKVSTLVIEIGSSNSSIENQN